jgi:hypothetical protein
LIARTGGHLVESTMKSTARLIAALVAGFAGAFAIAYVAFETLRALWPE